MVASLRQKPFGSGEDAALWRLGTRIKAMLGEDGQGICGAATEVIVFWKSLPAPDSAAVSSGRKTA
ncbi:MULTISPECIES: hypothetical protein [Rhizobium]|uniref:hypothetical protein n=1 Tax=Rhizobium phaseoli TaxID=396 RepID=UPI000190433B|nr:hypothetical protein [Rhizobium phaseoli]